MSMVLWRTLWRFNGEEIHLFPDEKPFNNRHRRTAAESCVGVQRLSSFPGDNLLQTSYDACGNRITKKENEVLAAQYEYDGFHRLRVVEQGETRYHVTYDSWGNRNKIEVMEDGSVVRAEDYQYDPLGMVGQILTMQEERTGETTRVFYGKELLGGSNGITTWTYQTDRLGSVIGRGDFTGHLVEEQWYEEFGTIAKREGTSETGSVFGFTGYLYEELIGLYDARAREYDPTIGGFLEKDRDPGRIGIALQRNRYGYCWNNPLRYVDPTGNYEVWVTAEEFLKWVAAQLGSGMGQVTELVAGAVGTAVSAAAPYVAIAVGAVTVVVTLDSLFEDTDSVLREPIREGVYAVPTLKQGGEILVPPRRTKELGDGIDLGPKVLYHPDGTWILEVPPKLELPILEAFTASLVPGLTILMTEAIEGGSGTEKPPVPGDPEFIGPLPTKNYGRLEIISNGKYSQSEVNAARYLAENGNDVVLRPPVGTRADGGTSDLLVNGKTYDVYTPVTGNSSAIIRAITKKNTQAKGIVLDLSETTVTESELGNILARVKGAIEKNGGTCNIEDIIVLPK